MTQINKVTNGDYKEILSTFLYMTNERFNCYNCKNSDDRPRIVSRIRKANGCFEFQKEAVHVDRRSDIKWFKCPANYIDFGVKHYINLYLKHEKGLSVFTESTENMSAKLVELIDIIDNLLKEFREKESSKNGKS
jgi:hypothetical protein